MGVDLTLIPTHPADRQEAKQMGLTMALAEITLIRRARLWEAIEQLPSDAPAAPLQCHRARDERTGGHCYGRLTHDPYGKPITTVTAGQLSELRDRPEVTDNAANRAAWAYLDELPQRTPVALLWT
jgi:hypothetical protein